MSVVISVQNLGKKYILSHQSQERYTALRDVLAKTARQTAQKIRHPFARTEIDETHEEFWALKEVSFDIRQGDRVGIIGRNGAGKSTLLKILSRITEPTTGKIKIKGRIASLLEVGTGFHPELTGRENIFLNGAILGMTKAEIIRKFDEIVAFAEIEKFLDTPVKRYSSGMYVRLAFAVASHLEPEILLVDEVLAVGDAHFQKKCLGKMKDVGQEGRTVIFVSHNMAAISALCTGGIFLKNGRLEFAGDINDSIQHYLAQSEISPNFSRPLIERDTKNKTVKIVNCRFYSENPSEHVVCGQGIKFEISYEAAREGLSIQFLIGVYDTFNTRILFLDSECAGMNSQELAKTGRITGSLSKDFSLYPGKYTVNLAALVKGELIDHIPNALEMIVEEGDFFGTGRLPKGNPLALVKQNWSFENNG